jgi:hypothetical protein
MSNKLYYLDESEKNRILSLHENYKKGVLYEINDNSLAAPKTNKDNQTPQRTPESNAASLIEGIKKEKGKVSLLFQEILKNPIQYNLPQKTLDSIQSWLKYPCVINSLNVVPFLFSDNGIKFEGGGHNWFDNGRSFGHATKQGGDYHCGSDGRIKAGVEGQQPATSGDVAGSNESGGYEQPVNTSSLSNTETQQSSNTNTQQPVNIRADYRVLTSDKIEDIRKKIGSTSTGNKLTQDDLTKLMEKLKEKSQKK